MTLHSFVAPFTFIMTPSKMLLLPYCLMKSNADCSSLPDSDSWAYPSWYCWCISNKRCLAELIPCLLVTALMLALPALVQAQSALSKPWQLSPLPDSQTMERKMERKKAPPLSSSPSPLTAENNPNGNSSCLKLLKIDANQPLSGTREPASTPKKLQCVLSILENTQTQPNWLHPTVQEALARDLLRRPPKTAFALEALFYLHQALFRQGKIFDPSPLEKDRNRQKLPLWQQERWLLMRAEIDARKEAFTQAANWLLKLQELPLPQSPAIQETIQHLLSQLDDPQTLEAFLANHPQLSWLNKRAHNLRTPVLLNAGKTEEAQQALQNIEKRSDQDKQLAKNWARELRELRKDIQITRIGVLLPFSSNSPQLREFAAQLLDGLRMAVQSHPQQLPLFAPSQLSFILPQAANHTFSQGQPLNTSPAIELVLRDSANQPRQAFRFVSELARKEKVIAIIGPLAKVESEAAAKAAESEKVPLIAFSPTMDIPSHAEFTFQNSRSTIEEAKNLAAFATEYLQLRQFAVLYPETTQGRQMRDIFWQEISSRGGRMVAAGSFQTLSQLGKHAARKGLGLKEHFEAFTGFQRPLNITQQKLLKDAGDSHPDPIVDFDALFIPIGPNEVNDLTQIARYPQTVDAENVQLLGNRFWHHPRMLSLEGGSLQNAIIGHTLDHSQQNPRFQDFLRLHRLMFGHRTQYQAPRYYTITAYDTFRHLQAFLASPRNHSRWQLSQALKSNRAFRGVAGWIRYQPSGKAQRQTFFLKIQQGFWQRILP